MRVRILILVSILITGNLFAQTNWNKVDYAKDYKRKVNISGSSVKSLKKNKTFIAGYTISQATYMKGSNTTATTGVHAKVGLGGLDNESYLQMVDELYLELIEELEAAGLQMTNGDDVLASKYVQAKIAKDKKDEFIGSTGDWPIKEGKKKISDGSIPGYGAGAVHNDVSFQPTNKNIYKTTSLLKWGNFNLKLAAKEKYNLMLVNFYVSFASFDGSRGYKDIKLETNAVMAVSVQIYMFSASGGKTEIYYKNLPIWGGDDWSLGFNKTKDNSSDAESFGLALSTEYQISADPKKYIEEAKSMISNFQKDIAKGIKENL